MEKSNYLNKITFFWHNDENGYMTSVLYDLRQPGLSENGSSLLDKLRDAFCASEENILVKYTETKVKQILMPSPSLNPPITMVNRLLWFITDQTWLKKYYFQATVIGTAAGAYFLEDGIQWGAAPDVKVAVFFSKSLFERKMCSDFFFLAREYAMQQLSCYILLLLYMQRYDFMIRLFKCVSVFL